MTGAWAWILVGLGIWLIAAAFVAYFFGGTVRERDKQVPYDIPTTPTKEPGA